MSAAAREAPGAHLPELPQADVAVVGGSYAGLSAALPLARARRRVLILDAGLPRNRFASHSHGLLAQDGRAPGDIVADARRQLLAYPTVEWMEARVDRVRVVEGGFELLAAGGRLGARRLLLATGVVDRLPDIPGLAARWGRHVFHCPYCHGYELDRGRIGVIATGPAALHQAMLLPEWGTVTLFANGRLTPSADEARALAERGVRVETAPVLAIEGAATVRLADGRAVAQDGLFVVSRTEPASDLAAQIGCEHEEHPTGRFIRTGAMKDTSVAGAFACGDVARAMGNVALAVGDGALAGTALHRSLVFG